MVWSCKMKTDATLRKSDIIIVNGNVRGRESLKLTSDTVVKKDMNLCNGVEDIALERTK